MNKLLCLVLLVTGQLAFSADSVVTCDQSKKRQSISVNVTQGAFVKVKAVQFITAYVWVSEENLASNTDKRAPVGGLQYVSFTIGTRDQRTASRKYTFNLKDQNDDTKAPLSRCFVTVKLSR